MPRVWPGSRAVLPGRPPNLLDTLPCRPLEGHQGRERVSGGQHGHHWPTRTHSGQRSRYILEPVGMNDVTVIPGSGIEDHDARADKVPGSEPVSDRLAAWLGAVSAEVSVASEVTPELPDDDPGRTPE